MNNKESNEYSCYPYRIKYDNETNVPTIVTSIVNTQ